MLTTATTARTPASSPAERYALAARAAGCPRDQLERLIVGGYVAQRHQLALHAAARRADAPNGPAMIGFGGRRGPGKTHATFAQIALDDCQRCPGLKLLFLRKVLKAGKESFADVRRKVLYATPHEYRSQAGVLEFPNGSRIILGHFRNEEDIDNYLGIEYDGAAIEEATQLSRGKVEMLRGSIRSTRNDWRPRVYMTTNPGGIGHQWFRSTFVLPWRARQERETCFLPASADENRYLDDGYRQWLAGLSGTLGKMWRDGDWDVAGGAFFTNWSYDRVVRPPLATVPAHWRVWLAMDYGFQHWNVIYLLAQDGDGNVWILDEHAARRWLISRHAEALTTMLARNDVARHRIRRFVAGHDCFAKDHHGATIADSWSEQGWSLERATIDRKAGAAQWLKRLGDEDTGLTATVFITTRCARLIETIPMLLSDPNNPEDVLKVDCDDEGEGGDDPYDGARYGLMEAVTPSVGRAAAGGQQPLGGAGLAQGGRGGLRQ